MFEKHLRPSKTKTPVLEVWDACTIVPAQLEIIARLHEIFGLFCLRLVSEPCTIEVQWTGIIHNSHKLCCEGTTIRDQSKTRLGLDGDVVVP